MSVAIRLNTTTLTISHLHILRCMCVGRTTSTFGIILQSIVHKGRAESHTRGGSSIKPCSKREIAIGIVGEAADIELGSRIKRWRFDTRQRQTYTSDAERSKLCGASGRTAAAVTVVCALWPDGGARAQARVVAAGKNSTLRADITTNREIRRIQFTLRRTRKSTHPTKTI
jgi:hypothetical protein